MRFTDAAHETPQNINRDAAIVDNIELVRKLARRFRLRVPPWITFDDLTSAGTIGLIEAVDRFDQSRGPKFRTYAQHRIWGAMMDFLRSEDPLSRDERRRVRELGEPSIPVTISLDHFPSPVVDYPLRTDKNWAISIWSDISTAARALSAREKRVIVLIYEQGWLNREIAVALKVNESRVSQIKHRTLSKMRAAIEADDSGRAA
jgi:RNA polymerase sigma factor (sigma-70 family)